MSPDEPSKLVIVATHGLDQPELATIPLVMANAALAMDTKVVLVLQSSGVTIATRGIYEHISAVGFDPVQKLFDQFLEFGGKALVCIPCLEPRRITTEMLVKGAEPVKAGRVVTEFLEADSVVCY
jgi:uncharacterized protein involved in oxidation of intracellular sulfur